MAETTQLEKFHRGEPLTPELEELRNGAETVQDSETSAPVDTRPINDDEREHLRRMKFEPGWPVIMRLLDREIQKQEAVARSMSMDDPLANGPAIAQAWAYVAMQKRTRNLIVSTLEQEVQLLEKPKGRK